MYKQLLYIFFGVLMTLPVQAQEFNYIHYDTRDGLGGNTIYSVCEDKDGFIWLGTENGLCRYDGTRFKNFTVKDGLPDNEVLKIFLDSSGRIWVSTFSNKVCFYYKGKIHTEANDSLLKKISFKNNFVNFVETSTGIIGISDYNSVYILYPGETPFKLSSADIFGYHVKFHTSLVRDKIRFSTDSSLTYLFDASARKVKLANSNLRSISKPYLESLVGVHTDSLGDMDKIIKLPSKLVGQEYDKNGLTYFINTESGTWSVDTASFKLGTHFLNKIKVGRTLVDREKNIWFCTMGQGLYKLPSTEIKTINLPVSDEALNTEAFSITEKAGNIIAGFSYSKFLELSPAFEKKITDFSEQTARSKNPYVANRLYTIKTLSGGEIILGFDGFLAKVDMGKVTVNEVFAVKSVDEVNSSEIVVGTSGSVFKLRVSDLKVIDTIFRERCTKVFYADHKYYIGSMNGLYEIGENRSSRFLGTDIPPLRRRVSGIVKAADGTMWFATADAGLVGYRDGKQVALLNESNGLSSDICKSLFLDKNFLWVGTNKGLNKIDVSKKEFPVLQYSISDGLPSDVINAVYIKDGVVWVATPSGLTYFNEQLLSTTSICRLHLLSMKVSDSSFNSNHFSVGYNNNNISFEYIAISFKSNGNITYHYRLKGLESTWKKTQQTHLDYPSLPPGDYELELYALNKFGIQSETISISFTIEAPFWQSWWFFAAVALGLVAVTIWLVNRRNKKVRNRLEENNLLQKQFAALEQQALQSQMNPHFIFNCLNSIQQYILTNDKEKANRYLTGFASLVRQTLDNSEKSSVTVGEEMEYLKQYLEMEKMRFGDTFVYSIETDELVQKDFTELPALLLQPYVENSLRHGLRYLDDKSGMVNIRFNMQGETLICSIKDNGVGRKKAAAYKSQQHIEYQSKGMSLTRKRIDLLNKMNETNIEVEIKDLADEQGTATGTEVIVKIPV